MSRLLPLGGPHASANARLTVRAHRLLVERVRLVARWHMSPRSLVCPDSARTAGSRATRARASRVCRTDRRPHRMPTRSSPELEARVAAARWHAAVRTGSVMSSTCRPARTRILGRHQRPHLPDRDPLTVQPIRALKADREPL